MRVTEANRESERLLHTVERGAGFFALSVQHALQAEERGLVRIPLQPGRQPFPRQIQVAGHQRRLWAVTDREPVARRFAQPGGRRFLGAREVAAIEMNVLEIVGAVLRIRTLRLRVGDARLAKPPNVQTDRGHPVVGPVKIGPGGQNLFQGCNSIRVLKILRRAPEDRRPSPMSLGQPRIQREGSLAVVLGFLQPRPLRVVSEMDLHSHLRQPGVRQREFRIALHSARQMCRGALQRVQPIGVALAQARHEIVVRLRIAAVSVAGLRHCRRKQTVQRFYDAASDFVLDLKDIFQREVMFLGQGDGARRRIEQRNRDAPL